MHDHITLMLRYPHPEAKFTNIEGVRKAGGVSAESVGTNRILEMLLMKYRIKYRIICLYLHPLACFSCSLSIFNNSAGRAREWLNAAE